MERSAGGVVLRPRADGVRVLLILDPYGRWGLPKGHVEEGETLEDAALREVREETGLEEVELGRTVDTIDWRFEDDSVLVHKVCTYYLMHSPRGEVEPDTAEGIRRCLWLPFDAAVKRVEYPNTREVVRVAWRMVREGEHRFDL